jgi:hypothetical protein
MFGVKGLDEIQKCPYAVEHRTVDISMVVAESLADLCT